MAQTIPASSSSRKPYLPTRADVDAFLDTWSDDSNTNTRAAYATALSIFLSCKLPVDDNVFRAFERRLSRRTYQPKGSAAQRKSGKRSALPYPRKPYALTTRRLYVSALMRFVDYLLAEDVLDDQALDMGKAQAKLRSLKSRRGTPPYRRPVIAPEFARLVTYYDDIEEPVVDESDAERLRLELLRNRAFMHTLYATGGRVSEVLAITRAGVRDGKFDETTLTGKGGKDRDLLFTPEAMKAIQVYCRARGADGYEALFISHRRGLGQPLSRVSGWAIVKRAAMALKMQRVASPHKFRHFRGQQLLNEGMSLDMVQAFLGHASPETTRRIYAPTDKAVLKDQFRTYGLPTNQAEEGAKRRAGSKAS
ncbi:MAG: tyrosine-type recombinase/integrase [Anaerolineae bacterium]|nr:tyrosine-type recombinase/integrase [Anaerolineae bacterium]